MTPPMLHLNGSGAKSLLEGYQAAYVAVSAALDALQQTAPHGRDYYTIEGGAVALREATHEHCARYDALYKVAEELRKLYQHVDDQHNHARMWARIDY